MPRGRIESNWIIIDYFFMDCGLLFFCLYLQLSTVRYWLRVMQLGSSRCAVLLFERCLPEFEVVLSSESELF